MPTFFFNEYLNQAWPWFLYKLFRLSFVATVTLVKPKSVHVTLKTFQLVSVLTIIDYYIYLKIVFPFQWLVLHVRGLVSFPNSLPLHNRMVVFQIYLQFKLQKRNLDPLVCKSCIKDSVILVIHVTSLGQFYKSPNCKLNYRFYFYHCRKFLLLLVC